MREVMERLRANGFKVHIVTGGDRTMHRRGYGRAAENVTVS